MGTTRFFRLYNVLFEFLRRLYFPFAPRDLRYFNLLLTLLPLTILTALTTILHMQPKRSRQPLLLLLHPLINLTKITKAILEHNHLIQHPLKPLPIIPVNIDRFAFGLEIRKLQNHVGKIVATRTNVLHQLLVDFV